MATLKTLKTLVDTMGDLKISFSGQYKFLIYLFQDSVMRTRSEETEEFKFLVAQIRVLHTLHYLDKFFKPSWSKETCYPGDAKNWDHSSPSCGQCAVTALVVQEYLGGKILYAKTTKVHHFWNELPDGRIVDFTREQFGPDIEIIATGTRTRESILEGDRAVQAKTEERYALLLKRIENKMKRINRQDPQCSGCGGCASH